MKHNEFLDLTKQKFPIFSIEKEGYAHTSGMQHEYMKVNVPEV
jgi:hypothetical protein